MYRMVTPAGVPKLFFRGFAVYIGPRSHYCLYPPYFFFPGGFLQLENCFVEPPGQVGATPCACLGFSEKRMKYRYPALFARVGLPLAHLPQ